MNAWPPETATSTALPWGMEGMGSANTADAAAGGRGPPARPGCRGLGTWAVLGFFRVGEWLATC